MAAPSIHSLRDQLRIVLQQEDDLLKDYKSMHGRLHDIDRELMTEMNKAAKNAWNLRPSWIKYMHGKRREAAWQMMMKREKTRPLVEMRKKILAQIIEMEIKIRKAEEDAEIKKADEGTKIAKAGDDTKTKTAGEGSKIKEPHEDTKSTTSGRSTKPKKTSEGSKAKRRPR